MVFMKHEQEVIFKKSYLENKKKCFGKLKYDSGTEKQWKDLELKLRKSARKQHKTKRRKMDVGGKKRIIKKSVQQSQYLNNSHYGERKEKIMEESSKK